MTMNNTLVNKHLGPCGLHCGKCFAFAEGEIHQLSQQLEKADEEALEAASVENTEEYTEEV